MICSLHLIQQGKNSGILSLRNLLRELHSLSLSLFSPAPDSAQDYSTLLWTHTVVAKNPRQLEDQFCFRGREKEKKAVREKRKAHLKHVSIVVPAPDWIPSSLFSSSYILYLVSCTESRCFLPLLHDWQNVTRAAHENSSTGTKKPKHDAWSGWCMEWTRR